MKYQIVVGNVGTVYDGNDSHEAQQEYRAWVRLSKHKIGRAAGEDVTFMKDGKPLKEQLGWASKDLLPEG